MKKVLFLCCHGICRGPMAKYILMDLLKKQGRSDEFQVDYAAVSIDSYGEPVYKKAVETLKENGIDVTGIENDKSRKISPDDYNQYDYIIAMDGLDMWNSELIMGPDKQGKKKTLMSYAGHPREEVEDPWTRRKFPERFKQIKTGCEAFLKTV